MSNYNSQLAVLLESPVNSKVNLYFSRYCEEHFTAGLCYRWVSLSASYPLGFRFPFFCLLFKFLQRCHQVSLKIQRNSILWGQLLNCWKTEPSHGCKSGRVWKQRKYVWDKLLLFNKKGRALNNKDIGSCCQKHYLKGMRNCLMEGLVYWEINCWITGSEQYRV